MVLQPSEERRRSGSHYTPRALTEPIVRTTLEPILARLRGDDGRPPRPEQILDLKVCDPAMGSGAFLVEACRQLGDALVEAWHAHGEVPAIPPDEDEVDLRAPARRAALPLRRGPEPRGGGPRQGLALARDAGEGPRAHLRGPRAAARRLAGRALARADRGLPLGADAAGLPGGLRDDAREHARAKVAELRRQHPGGGRERLRLGAARPVGRGAVRARQGAALRGPRAGGVLRGREAEGAGGEAGRVTRARS